MSRSGVIEAYRAVSDIKVGQRHRKDMDKASAKERHGARTDEHLGILATSSLGRVGDEAATGTGMSRRSSAHQFSTPNVDTIDGVQIKRLPAGTALGAHDLTRWSSNRFGGRSGSYTTKREREILENWSKPKPPRRP